jgi:hypothetical protein
MIMIDLIPSPGPLRGPISPLGRGEEERAAGSVFGFIGGQTYRGAMRSEASSRTTSPFK